MLRRKVPVKILKVKLLKDVKHFSIWQLGTFVLVFAVLGGFIIYHSFAYMVGDPPTAPTNLTASVVNSSEIQISWGASSSGSVSTLYYSIYRNNILVTTTTSLTYYNSGLSPGSTYTYFVTAHDQFGTSPASNSVTLSTPVIPPAPTGLTTHVVSSSEIDLSWGASASATGYMIFRNTGQINTTTSTSYKDTGLGASTTYTYYVRAYYQSAVYVSAPSNTVSATTLAFIPTTPSYVNTNPVSSGEIDLSWPASYSPVGIARYDVYESNLDGDLADLDPSTIADEQQGSAVSTSFHVTGLESDTSYGFYVVAVDYAGHSSAPTEIVTENTLGEVDNCVSSTTVRCLAGTTWPYRSPFGDRFKFCDAQPDVCRPQGSYKPWPNAFPNIIKSAVIRGVQDEGADYAAVPVTHTPAYIYAMGEGHIVDVKTSLTNGFRPTWIAYKLKGSPSTGYPAGGLNIYVAEHCTLASNAINDVTASSGTKNSPGYRYLGRRWQAGDYVTANSVLCTMQPGSIETGWAAANSSAYPAQAYSCYSGLGHKPTTYGFSFSQFIHRSGGPKALPKQVINGHVYPYTYTANGVSTHYYRCSGVSSAYKGSWF